MDLPSFIGLVVRALTWSCRTVGVHLYLFAKFFIYLVI